MYYTLLTKNKKTLFNLNKIIRIILQGDILIFETSLPNMNVIERVSFKYKYDKKEDAEKEFNAINKILSEKELL